jgi:Raf kinase inhibitor-like YbhB/YbcL family protein
MLLVSLLGVVAACGSDDDEATGFRLTSPAFGEGDRIPPQHALGGDNLSPPLRWADVPEEAAELALTVVDPDASNFVHWVVWGIAPEDATVASGELPPGAIQGRNQFGDPGWGGPQPPAGVEHTYVFTVHALERPSALSEGTGARDALARIRDLTVDTAELRAQFRGP